MIPLQDCKHRRLYRIDARNIRIGVYDEVSRAFFGLRTKFGSIFIDREFHWDYGQGPYGTAKPEEELERTLPDEIVLAHDLGTICQQCGRQAKFDQGWFHEDDRSALCDGAHAVGKANTALFEWLNDVV